MKTVGILINLDKTKLVWYTKAVLLRRINSLEPA